MMFRDRVVLLFLAVLCGWTGLAGGCYRDSASTCPYYELVNQVRLIPIPDPDHLELHCRQLEESLRCLLGPMVFGQCLPALKAPYNSMLNVLQIPCRKALKEYVSGRSCWTSSGLKTMMRLCYMRNAEAIQANYCNGQEGFINCTRADIQTVTGCGQQEQHLLTSMVITSYNDNGLFLDPPCHILAMPSDPTTTTTTTTTTPPQPTTTTTRKTTTTPTTTTTISSTTTRSSGQRQTMMRTTTARSEEDESISRKSDDRGAMVTQASRSSSGGSDGNTCFSYVCGRRTMLVVLVWFGVAAAALYFDLLM